MTLPLGGPGHMAHRAATIPSVLQKSLLIANQQALIMIDDTLCPIGTLLSKTP